MKSNRDPIVLQADWARWSACRGIRKALASRPFRQSHSAPFDAGLWGRIGKCGTRPRRAQRLPCLLDFAAFRRDHQLDELFGDFRLKAFSVALAVADDVGHDAAVLAVRILQDFGSARPRQMSPCIGARILSRGIVDVAGFGVGDFRKANARPTPVFFGPGRSLRQGLATKLMFARLENKRKICCRRVAQRGHGRSEARGTRRRRCRGASRRSGRTGGIEKTGWNRRGGAAETGAARPPLSKNNPWGRAGWTSCRPANDPPARRL